MTNESATIRPTVLRWVGGAACVLLAAGCGEEPTRPLDHSEFETSPAASFAVALDCTVDVTKGGEMQCEPASAGASGGPSYNLIVGSQHRFVRLANAAPTVDGGVWSADVTVQNLTLQPMATQDGETAEEEGVRVFFVDEPNNGVEVLNHDGTATFTGSEGQKYYEYAGAAFLGGDAILRQGDTSGAKTWRFQLNGAETFRFSVLVWTKVPDPEAYSVHLTRISAGGLHTCGDGSDGKVYCWGWNNYGQVGDGTTTDRTTPVAVEAPVGVTLSGVVASNYHTCADGSDGKVYCWGRNENGRLGDGTNTDHTTPTAVQAPADVRLSGVSSYNSHACAHGSDDKLYCWGSNSSGQLGNNSTTASNVPVAVHAPDSVTFTRVSTGDRFTCADGLDGKVYCWGRNDYGQLGNNSTTASNVPVAVHAPDSVTFTRVSTGDRFTCADGLDGKVYCWGRNDYGQLGNNSTTASNVPVAVHAPDGVTLSGVSAGGGFTCANGSDGKLYCWGNNSFGKLGNGTAGERLTPMAVQEPAGASFLGVKLGSGHACALSEAGPAYCWGNGTNGRLGNGQTTNSNVPVVVAGTY